MKIYVSNPEDGSILIEWVGDGFRVGFSIESDSSESSWYVVSKPERGDISAAGYLCGDELGEFHQAISGVVNSL